MQTKNNSIRVKKSRKYFEFQILHFIAGLRKIRYVLSELQPDKEDTITRIFRTFLIATIILLKSKRSLTVVSLPPSKWMTLNDNNLFSDTSSLITSWLQMSVLGLIGRGKDFVPFWNEQCKDASQRLWSPTETDSVGSPLNFWNGSSPLTVSNSWFSIKKKVNPQIQNSQTTSFPLSTFIPADRWADADTITKCRKIRVYPTMEQKKVLLQWMGTRRFVYNRVLENIKKNKEPINFYILRNRYVIRKDNPNVSDWETQTPKDIRAAAVKDLVNNMKSNFALLKRRRITGFKMAFLSRKKSIPSIEIPKTAIRLVDGGLFIYRTYMTEPIKVNKRDAKMLNIEHDCRLQRINNQWFLCVPTTEKRKHISTKQDFCSLDPGVRTFQTVYAEKEVFQVKVNDGIIKALHSKLDLFRSLRKRKVISRSHWKRRENKLQTRLSNLTDDLHYKTIHYITNNYKVIFLPKFESQKLAQKIKSRTINRHLLLLGHYTFRNRCKMKAFERGCYVDECTEEYTSQTCGRCGSLHKIGTRDIYHCPKCDFTIDRDVNGARNIAIKRLNRL